MPTQNRAPISDFDVAGTWSGAVGSRYTLVSDYPDTTGANFLAHGTAAGNIAFGFASFAIPANAFAISVQVRYYDAEPSNGSNNLAGRLRVGGTYYPAASHNPAGATYTARSDNWAVNPQTGVAWTVPQINGIGANALQNFGLVSTDANPIIRISSIELQVTFSFVPLVDYKFWFITRDDAGFIVRAGIRFFQGSVTPEAEYNIVDGTFQTVTRYRRTAQLSGAILSSALGLPIINDSAGNPAILVSSAQFGAIKTDSELCAYLNSLLVSLPSYQAIPQQGGV